MPIKADVNAVVLITGGNNGFGYYIAQGILEGGYRVAVLDIVTDNLEELNSLYPSQFLYYSCDVSETKQISKSVEMIMEAWGRIDVLVNNAALAIFKPFENKDIEETRKEFEVNYYGYIHMIKVLLPIMKKQGGGIIYNVSSGVGITGFGGIYGYSSTKGAIEALTKTLSMEFKPYNISVKLIHPPLMDTISASPLGIPKEFMDKPEDMGRKIAKKIFSNKSVLTPNFKTSLFLFVSRMFPLGIGNVLNSAAQKARTSNNRNKDDEMIKTYKKVK